MIKYKLNNWSLICYGGPYTPPELARQCLIGESFGHSKHEDGHIVVTSRIKGRCGDLVITKSGSLVELGPPKPTYEAEFPEAKRRLLESLPEITLEEIV